MVDNLKRIAASQKENLLSLEQEIHKIESGDLVTENKDLKTSLEKTQEQLAQQQKNIVKISEENKKLKSALYEQLYNEKIQILNVVNQKIDVYYKSNIEGEINRLVSFERSARKRIADITKALKANTISTEDEIYTRVEELKDLLTAKVSKVREEFEEQIKPFDGERSAAFSKLRQEQLTEKEIVGRIKQNNIESFIGLSLINKLGILLLVIGVIAASQYTYLQLTDMFKGVFAFVVGIVFLVTGELLNRKKPNIFSIGIISGGIAIMYVALAVSYFEFGILSMHAALSLCILITFGAFALSMRYNSQTIAIFAMIGGYLPLFSIAGNKTMVYGAMLYFVILNMLALIISVNKKWIVTAYIGFSLNFIGSIYIASIIFSRRLEASFAKDIFITILYLTFAFVIYTLIPVIGSFKKKHHFKNADIVLLGINTFISAILLYGVFYAANLSNFTGLLASIFGLVYLALGRFIQKFMAKEKKVQALFYITALTFVVLIVPFQFGILWLSLGWLIQGVSFLTYGIFKEIKSFKRSGVVICMLCFVTFMLVDVTRFNHWLFVYKYLAITLGSVVVLGALIHKKTLITVETRFFKYTSVINLWIFCLYIIGSQFRGYLSRFLIDSNFNLDYLITATMILISFVIAYSIPRTKILCDNAIKSISIAIYVIAFIMFLSLNFNSPIIGHWDEVPIAVSVVGTMQLIIISLLSILAMRDLILRLVSERKLGIEWYPLVLSFYFVVILTKNLIIQYNLVFNNSVISIIYLITSFIWITLGFIKRYVFIRRFGLGLAILSVAKLFIIDLAFLSQGYRILSYFVFGITLIAISFIYQYFNKKIDEISGIVLEDKESV